MRVIRLLALRRMRLQPLRAILAAVVVGAGTSLVVSILVITSSLRESVDAAGRSLAGPAPLRVVGNLAKGGVSPSVFKQIEGSDGVAAAIPLVQGIALVDEGGAGDEDDVPVMALGFDCRMAALFRDFECNTSFLSALEQPLVGRALLDEVGPDAAVRTNLGRIPLTGAIGLTQLDRLNGGRVVAWSLPEAQRQLGRRDGVDLVYVLPDPGVRIADLQRQLADELGPTVVVLDALDPPPLIGVVTANFLPIFTMVSLLTLGIGGVLVRNSITLSLEERRRQTAIVGALGGNRSHLVWGTILESAVLGFAGGSLGILGGLVLARPISGGLDDFMQQIAGISLDIQPTPYAVFVALAVGVGVSALASFGPARRSVRIDVAAELAGRGRREEVARSTSVWRLLAAAVAVAGGVGLSFLSQRNGGIARYQSTLAPAGFLCTMLPGIYLVGTAVPVLLRFIDLHVPFRRASTRLAVANLRREPRRTGVMAVALGFSMGMGVVTGSLNTSIKQEVTRSLTANLKGVEVSAVEPNNAVNIEARLSSTVLKQLERLPEVRAIDRTAFLVAGNQPGDLIGVGGYTDPWLDVGVATGSLTRAGLEAGEVAIGPGLARSQRLRPGDELVLPTRDGTVRLPVMAVVYNGDFGGRNVLMDFSLIQQLYGQEAPVAVLVQPSDGVSNEQLAAAIEAAELDPSIEVRTPDEVVERVTGEIAEQISTFNAVQRGLLVMSFIAVLSTLLLVGIQRQREFGMLAAVGMTPAELRRMILAEAGLVAILGVIVTGALSLVQFLSMVLITPVVIGYKDPYVVDLASVGQYAVIAVLVALAAAYYPSRRAGRVEVLDALRYE